MSDDGREMAADMDIPRPQDQPYMVKDVMESLAAELAMSRVSEAEHKARATHAHRLLAEEQQKVRTLLMENADLRDQLRAIVDQANASA